MNGSQNINLIEGGRHEDSRGILNYFNEFSLSQAKRFYVIEHPDVSIIRAWQGHQKEQKWFHVLSGSFKMVLIKPDDWISPSQNLPYQEFNLSADHSQILHVSGGYASGFQATESNSKLIVFSDFSTEESIRDDYRFQKDLWYKW